ncbi:hypothetical protein SDC9_146817 [bioreactor metagenome]|uniref:Uncharacterized protein n=1 Tax=bioreactor metagenome TaxID=1076179 RepID=A0A645EDX1_9ZZZZ
MNLIIEMTNTNKADSFILNQPYLFILIVRFTETYFYKNKSLHDVSGGSSVPSSTRPVSMEKLSSGFINTFVGMSTEVITLSL